VTESGTRTASSASPPTSGAWIVVRANPYETGRANVIVYNWGRASTVSVDVSSVLKPGDTYQLRNVQDYYGSPTLSGTYAGGSLQVPMEAVAPPRPIGRSAIRELPITGPMFNVFVLERTGS
jgi:hypothetical protein